MARLVFHVDDSSIGRATVALVFKKTIPDVELKQFSHPKQIMEEMAGSSPAPSMIFTDFNMAGITGGELLQWVKRNPKLHSVPVVMISAETDERNKTTCLSQGAFSYLEKPLQSEALDETVRKYIKQEIEPASLLELDHSFAEELGETVGEMQSLVATVNAETVKELYRKFHTIKGSANSLQFPHLGHFMHLAENFLNAVQQGACYAAPSVKATLMAIFSYLEAQAKHIQQSTLMALPAPQLMDDISLFLTNIKRGWLPEGAVQAVAPASTGVTPSEPSEVDATKASNSVRITNERLNDLQERFKKILQLRVQFNSFASQLKQEFSDESFPNDLIQLVEKLNENASGIMEFFISLRVMPVTRLKQFCGQVVALTARQLDKQVTFDFSSEAGLEVDQAVMEALEAAFTHILKNSIDHGIETPSKRLERQKPEIGSLRVRLARDGKEAFSVVIEDDGGGINPNALKAAFLKRGLMTQETLDRLSEESVLDLIFVDGLSTKDAVSDISGRGVGLSAVKEDIIRLGGSISVSSELGKGSRFLIRLPRYFKL